MKNRIAESGISENEMKKRKDIFKQLNENYMNMTKQMSGSGLSMPNVEVDNKPITQNEYMKMKKDKFASNFF